VRQTEVSGDQARRRPVGTSGRRSHFVLSHAGPLCHLAAADLRPECAGGAFIWMPCV